MSEQVIITLTTLPDATTAKHLAARLVEQKLAACATVLGAVTSVYAWQGEIQHDTEQQLLIKTTAARYPALEAAIRQEHPYELPEILALPVSHGLPGYLEWVNSCTTE